LRKALNWSQCALSHCVRRRCAGNQCSLPLEIGLLGVDLVRCWSWELEDAEEASAGSSKGCARPATPTTGRLPHTGPRQPPQSMYGRHGRHVGLLVLLRQSRFRGRIIRPRMRRDPCRLTSRREGRMQSTCCRLSGGPQGNLDRASAWAARSCCCCGSNSCEHSASSSSQPRVPRSLPASGT